MRKLLIFASIGFLVFAVGISLGADVASQKAEAMKLWPNRMDMGQALKAAERDGILAGCDAARTGGLLRKHGFEAPYGAAVTSLYGDVEAELR